MKGKKQSLELKLAMTRVGNALNEVVVLILLLSVEFSYVHNNISNKGVHIMKIQTIKNVLGFS